MITFEIHTDRQGIKRSRISGVLVCPNCREEGNVIDVTHIGDKDFALLCTICDTSVNIEFEGAHGEYEVDLRNLDSIGGS